MASWHLVIRSGLPTVGRQQGLGWKLGRCVCVWGNDHDLIAAWNTLTGGGIALSLYTAWSCARRSHWAPCCSLLYQQRIPEGLIFLLLLNPLGPEPRKWGEKKTNLETFFFSLGTFISHINFSAFLNQVAYDVHLELPLAQFAISCNSWQRRTSLQTRWRNRRMLSWSQGVCWASGE